MDYNSEIIEMDNPGFETYGSTFADMKNILKDETEILNIKEIDYSCIQLIDNATIF